MGRLYYIAKIGFVHQNLERIDHIELALKEMWANYILEKDISKKVSILEKIVMLHPIYLHITRLHHLYLM